MDLILVMIIVIIMAGILAILAEWLDLLTFDGAIASLVIGIIIGFFGSIKWLLLLIVFTVLGFAATKIGLARKRTKGVQEGKSGERRYRNVVAVGVPPCIFAVISFFIGDQYYMLMTLAFISTIAVAAADTIASEIGIKDKNVWMITTFKRVEPGVDGGVSVIGTIMAVLASIFTAIIGWILIIGPVIDIIVIVPIIAGILGCFADSLVGATLERRKIVSKYVNNALTAIIGAVFTLVVVGFIL